MPSVPESRRMSGLRLDPGWLWLIGGVVLLIAEVIAPGFFLIFIGAAAIATGLFTLLFGLGVAAAARPVRDLALLAVDGRPALLRDRATTTAADPLLNDRAARLLGKVVTVVTRSTSTAAACGSATANGRRAAAPPPSASACASSTSKAIA